MFTGIVTGQGVIEGIETFSDKDLAVLTLRAEGHTENLGLGGSLAVNGVCLSATELHGETLSVDVMGETLRRTTIGALKAGDQVNLERSTPAGGRLDGHVVRAMSTPSAKCWPAKTTVNGPPSASRSTTPTRR